MKKGLFFAVALLISSVVFAYAKLPASMLDKGYQGCIKDGSEPFRVSYCACLRDGMKEWPIKAYAQIALQMATSSTGARMPNLLEGLTKQCNASLSSQ